jgi:hypothetical protein
MNSGHGGPVQLGDLIAAVAAALPITPERAAANARLLDDEVAAWEATQPGEPAERAA